MNFNLHDNLVKKEFVIDLPLCRVLLEDNRHYPWLILVPRIAFASKMIDLALQEQILLLQELDFVQRILWEHFKPAQLNVAAIGNKTPQLHVHVIARQTSDPAWPGTVWDHSAKASYDHHEKQDVLKLLADEMKRFHLLAKNLDRADQ